MVVRQLQRNDLEAVISLIETNSSVLAPNNRMIYYITCNVFTEYSFVAEDRGEIVGIALVFSAEGINNLWLHQLAISPDFRRKGIAYRLMATLEEKLKSENSTFIGIRLAVKEDNLPAKALYEKIDYIFIEKDAQIGMEIYQKNI